MYEYFLDLVIVAVLVIGTTALNGVITSTIGLKLSKRGQQTIFKEATSNTQRNWKSVGGRNN